MKKFKQVVCILGILLLLGIYLITFIFAFTDHTAAKSWLSASFFSTFAIPLLLYAFLLAIGMVKGKGQEKLPEETEEDTEK